MREIGWPQWTIDDHTPEELLNLLDAGREKNQSEGDMLAELSRWRGMAPIDKLREAQRQRGW